ncbi:hypothetical protein [Nonomuraea sp. NPDC049400]|uniref:hypothetical protein n=1 Tax=Nonomuraea sp. NPDC049400 TaxID=3364352 RepID=UPI003795459C
MTRVHARHPDTGEHGLDAGVGQDLVHEGRELGIPVSDQVRRPAVRILQIHHEILDHLDDPAHVRVCGGAQHADTPADVLNDRQDVLALAAQSGWFP